MSKVVSLDGTDITPSVMSADVVEMLEELLDRARAGAIQGVAVALVKDDGNLATRWAGVTNAIPMAAAIGRLHFDYMNGWGGAS